MSINVLQKSYPSNKKQYDFEFNSLNLLSYLTIGAHSIDYPDPPPRFAIYPTGSTIFDGTSLVIVVNPSATPVIISGSNNVILECGDLTIGNDVVMIGQHAVAGNVTLGDFCTMVGVGLLSDAGQLNSMFGYGNQYTGGGVARSNCFGNSNTIGGEGNIMGHNIITNANHQSVVGKRVTTSTDESQFINCPGDGTATVYNFSGMTTNFYANCFSSSFNKSLLFEGFIPPNDKGVAFGSNVVRFHNRITVGVGGSDVLIEIPLLNDGVTSHNIFCTGAIYMVSDSQKQYQKISFAVFGNGAGGSLLPTDFDPSGFGNPPGTKEVSNCHAMVDSWWNAADAENQELFISQFTTTSRIGLTNPILPPNRAIVYSFTNGGAGPIDDKLQLTYTDPDMSVSTNVGCFFDVMYDSQY